MKLLLISVCILTFTVIGLTAKVHAAQTRPVEAQHDATFLNAAGEGIFPKGGTNDAYAQYFSGTSYLHPLSTEGVAISNVTFEPGCRNFWHIHHKGGQILLVTGGRGWYQQWGKPAQALKPGDVVHIPAGVKHWHGAARDSWFSHLAVAVPAEGASNEWLEQVADEEYLRLK